MKSFKGRGRISFRRDGGVQTVDKDLRYVSERLWCRKVGLEYYCKKVGEWLSALVHWEESRLFGVELGG